ncbi:MAG: 30S ribosomal protein S20 [Chloroflexi bacterium]|nr:30S ribosomal protein S20 [Chloroflexota bacterium]
MAHSTRTWRGARTPSAIKRVRQTARRNAINQPRRTEAKTLIARALASAAAGDADATRVAVVEAVSALDKAAKVGVLHENAANRRKSRLMLKVNAALGGEALAGAVKPSRTTGRTAAAKAAKARITASRATKAKGEQTAAGKARAALTRSTREEGTPASAPETDVTPAAPARKATARSATARPKSASSAKATATKPKAGSTSSKSTSSASKASATSSKATATKTAGSTTRARKPASSGKAADGSS